VRLLRPLTLAVALAVLGAAQAVAALRLPVPLEAVDLTVTKENYGFLTVGREMMVTFQLRNDGPRAVEIRGLGEDLPGLEGTDVSGSGEPFAFRAAGIGPEPLPAFDLPPGVIVVITLTYRLASCSAVPQEPRPLPVQVRDGRASGTVRVPIPQLPDDNAGATADEVVEWQSVLIRDLCA
jgi:hypothetical protein